MNKTTSLIKKIRILTSQNFAKNTTWIMAKTLYCSLLGFFIGTLCARFLGPSNYGVIGYGTAYISMCTAISKLGLNGFVINDVVKKPEEEGLTIGSALVMRVSASLLLIVLLAILMLVIEPDDELVRKVVFLQSLAIFFNAIEIFECWFKAKIMSKYVSIAVMVGYTVVGVWRIYLLANGASVEFFAASSSIEAMAAGIIIIVCFAKQNNTKLRISKEKIKSLFQRSKHLIVTAFGVALYLQTDKIMLKQMLDDTAVVGCYTAAMTIAALWEFVPSALIETATPMIIEKRKSSREDFIKSYQLLLLAISILAVIVGIVFMLLGGPAIRLLYGKKYIDAIAPMNILIWSTGFAMIGTSRGIWMIQENLYKYSKYYIFISAAANVVMNYFLIPVMGASGAAVATLATEVISAWIAPAIFPQTREFTATYFKSFKRIKDLKLLFTEDNKNK